MISHPTVIPERVPSEFESLPFARAFIDNLRQRIGSFDAREAIDALDCADRAYREFPELALERPRACCSPLVTRLLEQITRSDSRSSLSEALAVLRRFRELPWRAIEPVVSVLRQQGRTDTILQIISELLDRVTFSEEDSTADLADVLKYLLSGEHAPKIDGGMLVEVARSARRRLRRPSSSWDAQGCSTQALLAMTERFTAAPPPKAPAPYRDGEWRGGRFSFEEFLLQWPCEIELAANLDDAVFVEEAHRAVLLREPHVTESDQYLRLLRDGFSREWIIEDMLASEELRSLERRLRVVYGDRVITEPGNSAAEDMPAVNWPPQSAD